MYKAEPDPFPENEHQRKILESLYHKAAGTYNKWTSTRDRRKTYSYEEANNALAKYGRKLGIK